MKSIQHFEDKIKPFGYIKNSLILQAFIIILVAFGSYLLGRLSVSKSNRDIVEIIPPENGKLYYSNQE